MVSRIEKAERSILTATSYMGHVILRREECNSLHNCELPEHLNRWRSCVSIINYWGGNGFPDLDDRKRLVARTVLEQCHTLDQSFEADQWRSS